MSLDRKCRRSLPHDGQYTLIIVHTYERQINGIQLSSVGLSPRSIWPVKVCHGVIALNEWSRRWSWAICSGLRALLLQVQHFHRWSRILNTITACVECHFPIRVRRFRRDAKTCSRGGHTIGSWIETFTFVFEFGLKIDDFCLITMKFIMLWITYNLEIVIILISFVKCF